ncbi:efflux RND transporter permease subunit [Prolixibacteraceae bacterium JC049]|nr:efflux RND transporter permease subunit [Prolixibacteraceae bacterium JC049]
MGKENKKNIGQEIQRRFGPTYMALKNKTTVYILTVLLSLFGLFAYQSMPRELYPEIVVPNILIQTVYPGNSPVDIENFITRPIEKELKGLKGVKKMSSASYQDVSIIIIEFETDVEIKQALQDTKDEVDKAKSELPGDLEDDPLVMDLDFAEFPIMTVNLTGEYSVQELKQYAEKLQDEFEGLREISKAEIRGIDEREIQINLDPYKMAANKIAYQDVIEAIQFENVTMGAGEFTANNIRRVIRTQADYVNMEQIRNTIVKTTDGKHVYLRDIGDAVDGFKERSTISRLNGKPVVALSIVKKSGANILAATENVRKVIDEQKTNNYIPKNLDVLVTNDTSTQIRDQISNLENSILLGMILVIFVLYLFLGFRNAVFAGLAIPLSMFLSFVIIQQMGTTLNMMVLFSLILALGMLVDNAIVVVENVYRLYSSGYSAMKATKKGVSEIAFPIISSTLTTLAAFFPLLLWKGIMGEFMKILPQTLIIVLSSSLFVALVLSPAFISTFIKIDDIRKKLDNKRHLIIAGVLAVLALPFYAIKAFAFANLLITFALLGVFNLFALRPLARWFQLKFLVWLENIYARQLRAALVGWRPVAYFLGTGVLMILSIFYYFVISQPKVDFFPESDPQSIYVVTELPIGTAIDRTDVVSRKVEAKIKQTLKPYGSIVKSVTTSVGAGKGDMFDNQPKPNKSITTIRFVEFKDRADYNTSDIMSQITADLDGFVGAKIYVEKQQDGPPVGAPINIEVAGDEFEKLMKITSDFMEIIEADKIPGIDELKLDVNLDQPEMLIHIDREKARMFELSTQKIAGALRSSLYGTDVGNFKDGEDEYDIFLRLDEKYRNDVSTLMNQKVIVNGSQIPISAVASFSYSTTYDKIKRINNRRVITVSSNVEEGYNANEINARIKQLLMSYDMPAGYSFQFTGEQQEQAESSAFLMFALFVAVSLILIIMVTQFNSFIRPVIIIMTVLFSTIGVFLGLGFFNMEFVVIMTGIGIISLAGIVVNNGIVLIDYIDLTRKRMKQEMGLAENDFMPVADQIDAIVYAGKTRLRPVLLTAITTVLGLLPLAIGLNFNFFTLYSQFDPQITIGGEMVAVWGPMAWTVIFGLTFATLLTLVINPVMYILTIRINYRIKKLTGKL